MQFVLGYAGIDRGIFKLVKLFVGEYLIVQKYIQQVFDIIVFPGYMLFFYVILFGKLFIFHIAPRTVGQMYRIHMHRVERTHGFIQLYKLGHL